MFILTANYEEDIPEALYDRLEIIELSSYTEFEKVDIDTAYGLSLAKIWRVRYVPFVAVTKNDSNKMVELEPSCAVNLACANNIIDNFAK